ncbi:hypothetical protein [Chondrinema litorale]|uniref:hypothetical protein n=1 Tax=Chondrinema litorale TaxID=2994555 RepID=UPI0025428B88|nr:hypothetical protein [Chondrinema litorale]UZR98758.1 hypothetical protein OQ292_33465 [Chondrinema litorale]
MKLKIYLLCIFAGFLSAKSEACDICNLFECNLIGNKSYFGIYYRHRVFNGYGHLNQNHNLIMSRKSTMHEPEDAGFYADKTQKDYETYTTWELRGNYTIKNKVNIMMILPYKRNVVYYEKVIDAPNPQRDSLMTLEGWGDLTLGADYMIKLDGGKAKHILRPGFAVNVPTGQHSQTDAYGEVYDPIIQPGTGAWAIIIRMNYQYFNMMKKYGFYVSMNYKKSETGVNQYLFADSYNVQADIFYQMRKNQWSFIPKAGAFLETAGYNTYLDATQNHSGGSVLFGNVGMDINRDKVTLQTYLQLPIAENLNGNQLGNAGRINLGVIYNL